MVQGALGGLLFLDEAYALSGGGKDGDRGDSFSDEAPHCICICMHIYILYRGAPHTFRCAHACLPT